MVVPVHPFQGRHFYSFAALPRLAVDPLGLVQTVDGLSQCVVVAVALAANRGLNASLCQPLGIADRDVLAATVAVMDQTTRAMRLAGIQGLFLSIQHKVGFHARTDSPADDSPGKHVDHDSQPCQVDTYVKTDTHS